MDKEQLIKTIKLIEEDLVKNYTSYDEMQLAQIISQFQRKILELRKKDQDVHDELETLSANDLTTVMNEIDLCLLSPPAQKAKLVSVLNSLIIQEGKETQLLQMINKFNFLRTSFKKPMADEVETLEITPENIDGIRSEWLAHDLPEELAEEMARMNLKDLRTITKPWKLKSRSKEGLINLIIDYLKNNKNLTQ